MQSNVNQYMGSVHNLCFFPLLTLKQLQKVHVSAYKIRQIKHASCFIQDVCQYIFARAWTRSTSVNHILARILQKKRRKKSVKPNLSGTQALHWKSNPSSLTLAGGEVEKISLKKRQHYWLIDRH